MPSNRAYYSWKDSRLPPSLRLSPKSLPPCAISPAGERRRQAGVNAGTGGKKYIIKAARRARPQRTRQGLNPSRTASLGASEAGAARPRPWALLLPAAGRGGPGLPSALPDADPTVGAAGVPRLPIHGSGCGFGLSGRVSCDEGGARGRPVESPWRPGGKRKRRPV